MISGYQSKDHVDSTSIWRNIVCFVTKMLEKFISYPLDFIKCSVYNV